LTERLTVLAGLAPATDGRDLYDAIWLRSAIARLKPVYRDAAVLVAGQQLTHAEAAEILGVAEGTIKSRCARGRARMALALGYLRPGGNPEVAGSVSSEPASATPLPGAQDRRDPS
jgi:RNA polymerase sigma-70 factor (ECF subfamily)